MPSLILYGTGEVVVVVVAAAVAVVVVGSCSRLQLVVVVAVVVVVPPEPSTFSSGTMTRVKLSCRFLRRSAPKILENGVSK